MNFDKEEPANDAHNESLELILNEYHAKDSCMVINVGRERSIIKYLRSIGVQMLVDPVAKQDVYYKSKPSDISFIKSLQDIEDLDVVSECSTQIFQYGSMSSSPEQFTPLIMSDSGSRTLMSMTSTNFNGSLSRLESFRKKAAQKF